MIKIGSAFSIRLWTGKKKEIDYVCLFIWKIKEKKMKLVDNNNTKLPKKKIQFGN